MINFLKSPNLGESEFLTVGSQESWLSKPQAEGTKAKV